MNRILAKLSKKVICLCLGAAIVFGMTFNVSYGMGPNINPMQKLILEAIDLDKKDRLAFSDVLQEVTGSNYLDYVDEVSDIIPLSDQDIAAALKTYGNYDSTYKSNLLFMMGQLGLSDISAKDYTAFGFRRIQKMINFEVTGDYYDDRGIRLFVSIFKNLKDLTGKDAFYDKTSDAYKLDIKVGSQTLKTQMDKLIVNIETLKARGVDTFDEFTNYVEIVVNSHANIEIYNFKRFLKSEGLGYSGALKKPTDEGASVTPIQKLYLELISLSATERNQFVFNVLDALNDGNLAGVREEAQEILGNMPSQDLNAALEAFAAYSDDNKAIIKTAIKFFAIDIEDEGFDTSKFNDIYERINFAFTGDYSDVKGFMLFVKILGTIRGLSTDDFIYDLKEDPYKIDVNVNNLVVYKTFEPKLDLMIGSMDTLKARGITTFAKYIEELEATVNAHPDDQIYNFKKFLDEERLGYDGDLLNPADKTPEPTATPDPGSTPTPEPGTTATPTPVVTARPTSGGGSQGGGGSSGGSGGSGGSSNTTPQPTSTTAIQPTATPMPGANPFTDLLDTHWAKGNILELVTKEILTGYPDGTVKPDLQVTRAEMAVMIIKAIGVAPIETPDLKFKDKGEIGAWAAGYIQAAVEKKIIVGYEDNTFRPSNKLTREEMVVMVMKAYMYESVETVQLTFTDKGDIGSWSYGFVAKSVELKLVAGYPDNTFKPKKDVTRAEASTVISNCIKAAKDKLGN